MKLIFVFLFSIALFAHAGGDSMGNGGGLVPGEFVGVARATLAQLQQIPLNDDQNNALAALVANVELVRVVSQERLTLAGAEVDAINYPDQKLILVSQHRWQQNSDLNSAATQRLVLHEYLGVSGFNDSTYGISSGLILALQKAKLARIGTVKDALVTVNLFLQKQIEIFQKRVAQNAGAAAKKNFCEQTTFDETWNALQQSLQVNKVQLSAAGITNMDENIDVVIQTHWMMGNKCSQKTVSPESLLGFISQTQIFVQSLLGLF